MDVKTIAVSVVSIAIMCLLAVTLLIPVIAESTTTEDTFTNEGYFYMQKISAEDTNTYTLTYEYDDTEHSLTYTYNGDEIDTTGFPLNLPLTVATDGAEWVVRIGYYSEYVGMQGVGYGFSFGGHNTWNVEITFTEGTATAVATNSSDQSSTQTATYTDLWIYSPEPTEYVMKKADKPAYMLEDSEFMAVGVTSMSVWNTGILITGTLDDYTPTIFYPPNLTTTVTNKAIVDTAIDEYIDLYSLDKLTFTINDGTTTVDATYSYFIVPTEVTAERSIHPDANTNALLNLIPLLVIVGIILGTVGFIALRK